MLLGGFGGRAFVGFGGNDAMPVGRVLGLALTLDGDGFGVFLAACGEPWDRLIPFGGGLCAGLENDALRLLGDLWFRLSLLFWEFRRSLC